MLTFLITMAQFAVIDLLLVVLGFSAMVAAWILDSRKWAIVGLVCIPAGLLGPHFPEVTIVFVVAMFVWGLWRIFRK